MWIACFFFHVHRADNRFTPRLFFSHIHTDNSLSPPYDNTPCLPLHASCLWHRRPLFLCVSTWTGTKPFVKLFPLRLFSRSSMDTVKGIPAHALLYCYQHLAALSFLKWMEKRWEDGKNLLINAEHKEEATQRENRETKLFYPALQNGKK